MAKPARYTPKMIEEYTKKGYWEPTTLSDFWDRNAKLYPDEEALAESRNRVTWLQANMWIDGLALGFLERGIKKDDMIVTQLPNCIELCLIRVACEKAGIVCLPALPNLRRNEVEFILSHNSVKAIVIPWEFRGFNYFHIIQEIRPNLPQLKYVFVVGDIVPEGAISIREILQQPLDGRYPPGYPEETKCPATEVFLVLHTTGSTGLPKLVEYPMCCRVYSNREQIRIFNLTRDDIIGILGPAPGGPNNIAYLTAPEVGAKVVMIERFSPEEALKLIEGERVTFVGVVPAQLAMMLDHPKVEAYDLTSVRYWYSVGAILPYKVGVEVEKKMGGTVVIGYGIAEWGGFTITPPDLPREIRLLTSGKPIEGTEVKIVDDNGKELPKGDVGEVWGSGPCCVSGYYNDPEATRQVWSEDGWFRTGDLGKIDEEGHLVIVGRKKDMIIRGGQNIYPIEIENLLVAHPKVSEAAVVKMPDPVMGERACAYIVPRQGRDLTFDDMISFLKERGIAPFKLPERLEIVDALPMVGGGQKLDKKALERDIAEKLKSEGHRKSDS